MARREKSTEQLDVAETPPLRMVRGNFAVGEWTVLPRENRIKLGDRSVHLRPRVMDVLTVLAAQPGEVLARGDVIETVWRRRFIAESVLTRAIFELRQAFDDDPDNPQFVETVQGRGYRLLPKVHLFGSKALVEPASVPMLLVWRGQEVQLVEGETLIGRGEEATIRVVSDYVSRRHVRVVATQQSAVLEDLGAKNGTYLNGKRIVGSVELHHGDRITVGPTVLIFRHLDPGDTTVTELTHDDD